MPEGNEPNATPAAQPQAGQQPTINTTNTPLPTDTATTPTTPTTETPAASGEGASQQSPEVANPAAQRAAQEAARYRTELREAQKRIADFEAAQKAADEAQLSELEKAQRRIAEFQQREAQTTLDTQQRITRAEVRAEAARIGLNPQLAARIVDYAAIEYGEDGDPTNIAQLLSEAINAYGLQPQPANSAPATPSAPNVGATNPARQSGPLTITPSQYGDPAFKQAYMRDYGEDLLSAMNKGKVKIV